MTNEEINKAIAEHLGWKLCEREVQGLNEVYWVPPGVKDCPEAVWAFCAQYPPEYATNLNAMHEAEKMLTESQREQFRDELVKTFSKRFGYRALIACIEECIHATASQRAEAFLRAIGKWKENE